MKTLRLRDAKRAAVAAALIGGVAGCSVLGLDFSDEVILEGERIALRAPEVAPSAAGGVATLSGEVDVVDWPQAGGEPDRSLGSIAGEIGLTMAWRVSIGAGSGSESRLTAPPVAAGGVAYALDAAAQVTAVGVQSGERRWSVDVAPEDEDGRDGFGGGLAISDDRLIVATGFGELIALSTADGSRLWSFAAGAPLRTAPAIRDGLAIVVSRDAQVIAVDVATGEERWRVAGGDGGAGMLGSASAAISGEVVAAPFANGDIGIFRLRDGRRGWVEALGGARRGSALSLIADVSSPPVMDEGRIYAGGVSGRVVAFDIPTGRRLWSRELGAYTPVWPAGPSVFVISEDARILALDALSGRTIWERSLPRYDDPDDREDPYAYSGPILVGGTLYMASTAEQLTAVDARTGDLIAVVDLPNPASLTPIYASGHLILLDDDGVMMAFR